MPESPNLISSEQPPKKATQESTPNIPQAPEQQEQPKAQTETQAPAIQTTALPTVETPALGDETFNKVEGILSKDLDEYYQAMNPQEQQRFQAEGEKVSHEIANMLDKGKVSFKKFVTLITGWLKLIPGVNKFFLQKEAKLRADEIIRDHEEEKGHPGLFGVMLAQADLFSQPSAAGTPISTGSAVGSDLVVIISVSVLALIAVISLLIYIRWLLRSKHDFGPDAHLTTLQLSIPKEQQLKDKTGDASIEQIRAQIATGESFLSTIGGLKAQRGIMAWFFGRSDQISFEIVAQDGLIYFYMAVPKRYRSQIEQQLQAQYPSMQIDEADDYNFFKPKDVVIGATLQFTKPYSYPFKTYQQTETDPLNGLLNPLTKIGDNAGVAIQYVVRSAKKEWRGASKKAGKDLAEGKKESSGIVGAISTTVALGTGGEMNKGEVKPPHQPTQMEQELIKKIDEKQSRAGLDCNARIIVSAPQDGAAQIILKNVLSGYSQYNMYQFGNSFKAHVPSKPAKLIEQFIYRKFDKKQNILVNTEEMASLWHLPTPYMEISNIKWLTSRSAPPPENAPTEGIEIGFNMYRRKRTEVRMKVKDRRRHLYAIGMTGTGKSTLLSNMASRDAQLGNGFCIMDPHGDLADAVIGTIPPSRIDDVVYFDPADTERPIGLNMLEFDPAHPQQKTFVINEFYNILDRMYNLKETGGPMFETYLRNAILLNMSHPESGNTIMEISQVLADEEFRNFKLSKCDNKQVSDFWIKEAGKAGGEASLQNMVPYITSKLNQFISNDIMRPIIGQQKSSLDFRDIMDNKKILLINLSKGKLGEKNSNLIGLILIGKILQAALARVDTPEEERQDFYVYIDEFQNYLTDTIATILAEARKYRLILNVAHQYIGQLEEMPAVKDAIFGNVGTKVSYRIGVEDAEFMAKEFEPVFNQFDLMNVASYNYYVKLMIDNAAARPFNVAAYPPPESDRELQVALKEISRLTYGRDREIIEREIKARNKG